MEANYIDVQENLELLGDLCADSDVVISLLPYALHGQVAKHCIANKTHLVTASYVTDAVQELHEA